MNYLFVYITFLLAVIFVPKFNSIDIIGPQWVYLSILNLVTFVSLLIFYLKLTLTCITNIFANSIFRILFIFFVLMLLSFIYSNNVYLSAHDFSRNINLFAIVFNIYVLFSIYPFKFLHIALIFSFFLFCEIFYSLQFFFRDFYLYGFDVFNFDKININAFLGYTGNKNIAAASIVFKLPMLFYLIYYYSNKWMLGLLFFITSLSFFNLFILSARASLISLLIILFFFIGYLIYNKRFIKSFILMASLSFAYFLFSIYLPENTPTPLNRVSSIEFSDESSSFRLGLWNDAFNFTISHPLYGVGLGNWKVESAKFWKSHGQEYIVPYHAHNDFLEIGTELGLIGFFVYFSLFCFSFYFIISSFFRLRSPLTLILLLLLCVYFIDAFFNFPLERPIMQVPFGIILSMIIFYSSSPKLLVNEHF